MRRRREASPEEIERRAAVIAEGERRMAARREKHLCEMLDKVNVELARLGRPDGRTVTLSRALFEVMAECLIWEASDWHSYGGHRPLAIVFAPEFQALLSAPLKELLEEQLGDDFVLLEEKRDA